jgi:hypothetical protein
VREKKSKAQCGDIGFESQTARNISRGRRTPSLGADFGGTGRTGPPHRKENEDT